MAVTVGFGSRFIVVKVVSGPQIPCTISLTENEGPAPTKVWLTDCPFAVFDGPDNGSPKSHSQSVIFGGTFGGSGRMDAAPLNVITLPIHDEGGK